MSEGGEVDVVLSLEDLFLSQEFGKPRATMAQGQSETLFGRVPPRGPLVPLAGSSLTGAIGHHTTTHERRTRTLFAAVSGVTAVLLIAVGVAAQNGTNNGPNRGPTAVGPGGGGHHGGRTTTTTTQPSHQPPKNNNGNGPNAGGAQVGLASLVTTSGRQATPNPVLPPIDCEPGCVIVPIPKPSPTPVTPTGTVAPKGSLLTPVVVLVGHAVTTVGATVSTASTGLTVTLPPLSPVTGLVDGLGGGLSGLGNMLSGTTI